MKLIENDVGLITSAEFHTLLFKKEGNNVSISLKKKSVKTPCEWSLHEGNSGLLTTLLCLVVHGSLFLH